MEERRPPGIATLVREHWRPLLVVGGLVIALNVVNYTLLSYMPTYLERRLGLATDTALIVPISGMLFMMLKDMLCNASNTLIIMVQRFHVDFMTLAVFRVIQLFRVNTLYSKIPCKDGTLILY